MGSLIHYQVAKFQVDSSWSPFHFQKWKFLRLPVVLKIGLGIQRTKLIAICTYSYKDSSLFLQVTKGCMNIFYTVSIHAKRSNIFHIYTVQFHCFIISQNSEYIHFFN